MFQKLLVLLAVILIYCSKQNSAVIAAIGFSILGYFVTNWLIPRVGPSFIKIGLFGKDLSKPGKPVLPETIGAVSATVYLFVMLSYIPFIFYKYMIVSTTGGGQRGPSVEDSSMSASIFPHNRLSEYLSSILCLESTILIGIADDLFDLRWRHKFFLPVIGSLPLLLIYYVDFGVTYVLIPGFIKKYFNLTATIVDLGGLYYVYMAAMGIFCPNSINILAGVNGLEVGQSIVISILELLNDILYLTWGSPDGIAAHRFSAVLIIPFLGVSLALWKWNRWPAKVFVGDTYCYFAGMVFAVVGILGHFSKTMLMLFIPQILNFIYSCPQLFNIVPCPRHRLPRFEAKDGLMYPSRANLVDNPPKLWFITILKALAFFHLIELEYDPKDKSKVISCSNMTLINLTLVWFGPMREDALCNRILQLQFMVGLAALFGRHAIGALLFDHDNLWT
ncbi:UDP-N-acetylglucosamine--dolichyl-phosphate N-acetylglucosaminephosphotransferase NDAI_0F02080 [Naumovozyma dairenensis CBS 421]|uniref:UDP-N-acetylglucosamine--dolichyl-phosphate N-acetylglucosaminephosphotransferase n=1 Tax=Naumovozyma dairenensis (strain ATCC 10597 / BCRC 20456 / CBS 421 / NBRC 0211 / NRRL Y-12639) TaxID=1071378 RepID=G0WCL5_NAUDC|nr:hypothetical protein NDAI_0F02080 [Naumovozyma dairenensis CBS 421]CCD25526.1 hypothetical protein NDAI_0F02080 [Naumovozyma dairenensis CBS 421]